MPKGTFGLLIRLLSVQIGIIIIFFTNKTIPKRIQLPDDFYKHDFKQLAKVEKHPRTIALLSIS
jgi:hypothetical protein